MRPRFSTLKAEGAVSFCLLWSRFLLRKTPCRLRLGDMEVGPRITSLFNSAGACNLNNAQIALFLMPVYAFEQNCLAQARFGLLAVCLFVCVADIQAISGCLKLPNCSIIDVGQCPPQCHSTIRLDGGAAQVARLLSLSVRAEAFFPFSR